MGPVSTREDDRRRAENCARYHRLEAQQLGCCSQDRSIGNHAGNFPERHPANIENLVRFEETLALRFEKETDIEVSVRRPVSRWWNRMYVDVKDPVQKRDAHNTGLFLHLTNRGIKHVLARVYMTARLEPGSQLAMVDEQQAAVRSVYDKCACRDVARCIEVGRHHIAFPGDQIGYRGDRIDLIGGRCKAFELETKAPGATHRTPRLPGATSLCGG